MQTILRQFPENELPDLPVFNLWLARTKYENNNCSINEALFKEFAVDYSSLQDNAESAICLNAEKNHNLDVNSCHWLRADPVYVMPDRDTAVLVAHDEISLAEHEVNKIVEDINQHFVDEPWHLHAPHVQRWYLQLAKPTEISTTVLNNVLGQDINPVLPEGKDSEYWHRCLNELQMLLHGHPVNFERESRGQYPVNSLWLWGHGSLPAVSPVKINKVYGEDILIQGLAKLHNLAVTPLTDYLEPEMFSDDSFIYLDIFSSSARNGDIYSYLKALKFLNDALLRPFNQALKAGKIKKIRLLTNQLTMTLTPKLLRRWWKLPRNYSKWSVND